MNHLLRSLAPITEAGWELLDQGARERVTVALASRKVVDFAGPHGWEHSATSLGRTEPGADPIEGVLASRRRVLPLVELHSPFTDRREELDAAARGAVDVDLASLDEAARCIARAENVAVFHGLDAAGIAGIANCATHAPVPLGEDFDAYPGLVARAVGGLRAAAVGGLYALAIGPEGYTGIVETTEGGGTMVLDHLRKILDGPVVWVPGVQGAIVLSLRGGDFLFESGQDLALGYEGHDERAVRLYLEESFSFRTATPEAAATG